MHFAQTNTEATISTSTCHRTPERNKEELPDFYSIYAGNSDFEDYSFRHTSSNIFAWSDAHETNRWANHGVTWKRVKDAFAGHTMFGTNGITPQDMRQGSIGNCWFISAASALAEVPGRVEKIFLNANNEISANGIYAVQLYTLGIPHTVIVDDWLPLRQENNGEFATLFAKVSEDSAIYGPILEKALAKYHGNYSHIIGGDPRIAI